MAQGSCTKFIRIEYHVQPTVITVITEFRSYLKYNSLNRFPIKRPSQATFPLSCPDESFPIVFAPLLRGHLDVIWLHFENIMAVSV